MSVTPFCSKPVGCGLKCDMSCPPGIPHGYYPDLKNCNSYCYCTGSAASSRYETCNAGLSWDILGWNTPRNWPGGGAASFSYLASPHGEGTFWGTTGGHCRTSDYVNDSRPAKCGGTTTFGGSSSSSAPTSGPTAAPTLAPTLAPTTAPTSGPTAAPTFPAVQPRSSPTDAPTSNGGGVNSDPIILGLQDQVFKFEGRNGAWYSNLSSEYLQWNMQFKEFDTCPKGENMFVSGMTISIFDDKGKVESDIMIATTPEATLDCQENPDMVCLGDGTLHLSFDGGKTFVSQPGNYHFSLENRVVAHNTYAACSRKWHDYNVRPKEQTSSWFGSRRVTTVEEKKPLQLLLDKTTTMIDPDECNDWIEERVSNNDLFQQRGQWSTVYIETPLVSFHVEYRRSDWFHPACDYQSVDAWMTNVSEKLHHTEWNGILGETRNKLYDTKSGAQIKADRSRLLRGRHDSDYEVEEPFGTKFDAKEVLLSADPMNQVVNSVLETLENSVIFKDD